MLPQRAHGDVTFHLLRSTARAAAEKRNRRMLRQEPRFRAMKSGRRLYRWKVVDDVLRRAAGLE